MSVRRPILPSMPALGALAALVAGILAGYFTGSATVWLTVGTVAATLIAYVADRRRIAALGLFAVLGMAAFTLARPPRVDIPETGITVAVTAHVAHARQNELNQRLVLEVEEGAWKGVRLLVYSHAHFRTIASDAARCRFQGARRVFHGPILPNTPHCGDSPLR